MIKNNFYRTTVYLKHLLLLPGNTLNKNKYSGSAVFFVDTVTKDLFTDKILTIFVDVKPFIHLNN